MSKPQPKVNAELQKQYDTFKSTLQQLQDKIVQLESEHDEYSLVLETLDPLEKTEPERNCFRMIGGVLIETTVGKTAPVLKDTQQKLQQVIETLKQDFVKTETAMAEWQKQHKVQVVRAN